MNNMKIFQKVVVGALLLTVNNHITVNFNFNFYANTAESQAAESQAKQQSGGNQRQKFCDTPYRKGTMGFSTKGSYHSFPHPVDFSQYPLLQSLINSKRK